MAGRSGAAEGEEPETPAVEGEEKESEEFDVETFKA